MSDIKPAFKLTLNVCFPQLRQCCFFGVFSPVFLFFVFLSKTRTKKKLPAAIKHKPFGGFYLSFASKVCADGDRGLHLKLG